VIGLRPRRTADLTALAAVTVLALLVAVGVGLRYQPRANVAWDEALYTMAGYRISAAVRSGDLSAAWRETREQFAYPPLPSWILAVAQLPVEYSVEATRRVNLGWFMLGAVLIHALGTRVGGRRSGVLSALLYLSSPLVLVHATLALREMMGATLSLLTMLLYFRARARDVPGAYACTALGLLAVTMTKYNYGVLLLAAIAIEEVIGFLAATRTQRARRLVLDAWLFVPVMAVLGWWIFLPANKLQAFVDVLSNRWTVTAGLTDWRGVVLFYPRAIVLMYSASAVIGVLLLLGFVAALRSWRDFRIRTLWMIVALNVLLGVTHDANLQERFVFTAMPFLFVVAADALVRLAAAAWLRAAPEWLVGLSAMAVTVLAIKLLIDLGGLPGYVYAVGAYSLKSPTFNQLDYTDTWFNYDTASWPREVPAPSSQRPADVVAYVADAVDVSKPVRIVGFANELPPDSFALEFARRRDRGRVAHLPDAAFVVTIEVSPASRYYTRDYRMFNVRQLAEITQIRADPTLAMIQQRAFDELGMQVAVYAPRR